MYKTKLKSQPLHPAYDPWDPITSLERYGKHKLTSVEFTVTNLCNMRCEHCAVGDVLSLKDGQRLPLALMLKRLDEIETLETISITGGEPSFHKQTVDEYIIPLLKYGRERGLKSQINSNLTLDVERYEDMAPWLDVMHISINYTSVNDFNEIAFVNATHKPTAKTSQKLYDTMLSNAEQLSKAGLFISAESMINYRTHEKMPAIHDLIVQIGCQRHEVHPMYPSSFAAKLPAITVEQMATAIHSLLDHRDPRIWMLFGTLPFYHCNPNEEQHRLLGRLLHEKNVTVRNDPDGRNRLNVNTFTGDIYVTDFADVPSMGNIRDDQLDQVFESWLQHPLNQGINCHCAPVHCCGPNLLVKNMYYKDVDFTTRKAIVNN
ncbi:radical SAM/CxCxxxxC motif protein YfkAB [Longirhabdus pacifica]|uniref:radical SAM/CxCxxxxC motif protein YfkAB n=1 Tax=Longirhabdus pacifica TaxID=2305227 RepID=UPI001F0B900B|nr:radical SAM/CxCxxxxC motif protein YfkAB [Longirhabdus pacifica]